MCQRPQPASKNAPASGNFRFPARRGSNQISTDQIKGKCQKFPYSVVGKEQPSKRGGNSTGVLQPITPCGYDRAKDVEITADYAD